MIDTIRIIGARGRVGSTVSARLASEACDLDSATPRSSSSASPTVRSRGRGDDAPGRGSRTSRGATPLAASTAPGVSACTRCRRSRPAAAPSSSTEPGPLYRREGVRAHVGSWLAETLGLPPFDLDDEQRAPYHAGAAIASNYLVTLRRAAGSLLEAAGAPPEALDPLMRGVIGTGYELTGPIERGDWETVDRHLDVIRAEATRARGALSRPRRCDGLTAGTTRGGVRMKDVRTIEELRARARPTPVGARSGSSRRWARSTTGTGRSCARLGGERHSGHEPFRQPRPVRRTGRPRGYPRDEDVTSTPQTRPVPTSSSPDRRRDVPTGFQTWVDVTELGAILEGEFRPGHFNGVATVCSSSPTSSDPLVRTSGRRTPSRSRYCSG